AIRQLKASWSDAEDGQVVAAGVHHEKEAAIVRETNATLIAETRARSDAARGDGYLKREWSIRGASEDKHLIPGACVCCRVRGSARRFQTRRQYGRGAHQTDDGDQLSHVERSSCS